MRQRRPRSSDCWVRSAAAAGVIGGLLIWATQSSEIMLTTAAAPATCPAEPKAARFALRLEIWVAFAKVVMMFGPWFEMSGSHSPRFECPHDVGAAAQRKSPRRVDT